MLPEEPPTSIQILHEVASVEDFLRLRKVSGLSERPRAAAEKGLPNSLFGVVAKTTTKNTITNTVTIGMGRVVGDGGLNFEIVDVAVDPLFQGKGIGREIMQEILKWLDIHAPEGSYISLVADVPPFYEKLGFKYVRPESEGMYMVKKV